MAEESAVVATEPQAPAEPVSKAPGDAPVAPEPRGAKKESFAEKWARHGGNVDDLGDKKEPEAAEAAPSEPATKEPEPAEPKKPEPAHNAELAQLKELAKKLGMSFDGGRVTTEERAEFREAKRRQRSRLEADREAVQKEVQEYRQNLGQELETATRLFKARDDGDWNGLAQVLGFEDYNAMQREVATRVSDPNYRRMRELEEWRSRQEQAEQERQAKAEEARVEQDHQRAISDYVTQLSTAMRQSEHPVLKALGGQRFFVQAVHAIQREQYDGDSTVTPEEALLLPVPGSTVPLAEELRAVYGVLHQAFGGATAPKEPAAGPAKKQDQSTVKSAPVPPTAKSQASAPKKLPFDRRDFTKYALERIEEEELQTKLASRS